MHRCDYVIILVVIKQYEHTETQQDDFKAITVFSDNCFPNKRRKIIFSVKICLPVQHLENMNIQAAGTGVSCGE